MAATTTVGSNDSDQTSDNIKQLQNVEKSEKKQFDELPLKNIGDAPEW
eukprot:CAMPEP_0184483754 /NCGR_PEP_ID=MMETSP0113_2-20130426/5428_1 /TAXON_ID=91329 /ORGANISM="Norrisiella sphaerica, Strain BC52" /LENGTH=47 /DNA_ID= /DNA_START= /DNA_END= /DNA_ORIENTATION=